MKKPTFTIQVIDRNNTQTPLAEFIVAGRRTGSDDGALCGTDLYLPDYQLMLDKLPQDVRSLFAAQVAGDCTKWKKAWVALQAPVKLTLQDTVIGRDILAVAHTNW